MTKLATPPLPIHIKAELTCRHGNPEVLLATHHLPVRLQFASTHITRIGGALAYDMNIWLPRSLAVIQGGFSLRQARTATA